MAIYQTLFTREDPYHLEERSVRTTLKEMGKPTFKRSFSDAEDFEDKKRKMSFNLDGFDLFQEGGVDEDDFDAFNPESFDEKADGDSFEFPFADRRSSFIEDGGGISPPEVEVVEVRYSPDWNIIYPGQLAVPMITKILVDGEDSTNQTTPSPPIKPAAKEFLEVDLQGDDYLLVSRMLHNVAAAKVGEGNRHLPKEDATFLSEPQRPDNCIHVGLAGGLCALCELTWQKTSYRRLSIQRWRAKKSRRQWKSCHYAGRSAVAYSRPRSGGRFVKLEHSFVPITQLGR